MATNYITRTRMDHAQLVSAGDMRAVESYPALRTAVEDRAGAEAAALFAEPRVSLGNDTAAATISWYTELPGDPKRLRDEDGPGRADAEARLSRLISALRPLLRDPELGPLVGAALHIQGPEDVWLVGGRPVLINWGVLPKPAMDGRAARGAHYAATLGRFLPLETAPPISSSEVRAQAAAEDGDAADPPPETGAAPGTDAYGSPAAGVGEVDAAGPPAALAAAAPSGAHGMERRYAFAPLLALLVLAAIVLLWLLWPGTRIFPNAATALAPGQAAHLASETNRALEERAAALEAALDGMVCRDDGTLVLPDGRTPEGFLPPPPGETAPREREAEIAPDTLIPPSPSRLRVPGDGSGGDENVAEARDSRTLLGAIEAQTVLVLVSSESSGGSGTGFFIGPDLVVTNHHVVESALSGGSVFVTNNELGEVREAEILKTAGPFEETGLDFALLRVPGAEQPYYTLRDSDATLKLQNVIAAGYPADLLETDARFSELLSGSRSAMPDITVTEGIVSTEQPIRQQSLMIVHSASTSRGNSGGPLVDMCGRVVGVNTFVRTSEFRNFNLSLSVPDLAGFLGGTPAAATTTEAACRPQLARIPEPEFEPETSDATPGPASDGD